jgi:hypothetical protein
VDRVEHNGFTHDRLVAVCMGKKAACGRNKCEGYELFRSTSNATEEQLVAERVCFACLQSGVSVFKHAQKTESADSLAWINR